MAVQAGQTKGNENEARQVAEAAGISNPSSGIIRYIAYGDTNFSFGDAERMGISAGLKQTSEFTRQERQKAIEPALESLRATKPEVAGRFDVLGEQLEAEKDPLNQRYDLLVEQLRGREAKDVKRQTQVTGAEFGKRGIDPRSGIFQTRMATDLADISQFFGTQQKEVGFAREADLKDIRDQIQQLGQEEISTMRSIDQAIANLQAGAGNQAITDALEIVRQAEQRKFDSRFDELEIKERELRISESQSATAKNESITFLSDLIANSGGVLV